MPVIPFFKQQQEDDDALTIYNQEFLRIRQSTDKEDSNRPWIERDPRQKKSTQGAAKEAAEVGIFHHPESITLRLNNILICLLKSFFFFYF